MAYINSSSSTMVPNSIAQAINFLTRPLILSQTPDMISSLQFILRSTLQAAYFTAHEPRLSLALSAISLPPRPVYAACIASGMQWSDWISLLGGRDFDLVIEPRTVSVTYFSPKLQTVIIWSAPVVNATKRSLLTRPSFEEPQIPISKLGQQSFMQASLRATVNSAVARAQTRTLAQQLLESDHKEADEIFAMISKSAILSPTPTREHFALDLPTAFMPKPAVSLPSSLSYPEVYSPESSRPSSRSSTFSTFSFSSDEESMTSASSTTSFDFLASTKPSTSPFSFRKLAKEFVPRCQQAPTPPPVIVDNNKKDVTKYLYQGGVSTVLTGGVMLGGAAAPKTAQPPKYKAPGAGRKPAFTPTPKTTSNCWRRPARV